MNSIVSDKTIARVLKAVNATGYIPNRIAGGLKSKRSMKVAALVPTISVSQFLPTVQALTESFDAAGYLLILGQSGYVHSREEALLNTIISRRPELAQGVLAEAQSRGIRIPEELAVCGFGDADFAAHMERSLTTIQVDGASIGRLAARMILDRCGGLIVKPRGVDVGFRIVERKSTGGVDG